jgi:hypothetical protein
VTKRSKFFKITEVQTKASFELSLPRVPLFYPSARSREGTVWYTSKYERRFSGDFPPTLFGTLSALDLDSASISRYIPKISKNNYLVFFISPEGVGE